MILKTTYCLSSTILRNKLRSGTRFPDPENSSRPFFVISVILFCHFLLSSEVQILSKKNFSIYTNTITLQVSSANESIMFKRPDQLLNRLDVRLFCRHKSVCMTQEADWTTIFKHLQRRCSARRQPGEKVFLLVNHRISNLSPTSGLNPSSSLPIALEH